MSETTMAKVMELLNGSEEWVWLRNAHLEYYLALAEQAEPHLQGPDPVPWLDLLESERDNLRVAFEWALTREDESALRLCTALGSYWMLRDVREGRRSFDQALDRDQDEGSAVRARALYRASWFALDDGKYARDRREEALVAARASGNVKYTSLTLAALAQQRSGRPVAERRRLAEEALELARECADRFAVGIALLAVAESVRQEDTRRALSLFRESVALWRELGNTRRVADSLIAMAGTDGVPELLSPEEVQTALEEAVTIIRGIGGPDLVWAIDMLGWNCVGSGDVRGAIEHWEEALAISTSVDVGIGWADGYFSTCLGHAAYVAGDLDRARALIYLPPTYRDVYTVEGSGYALVERAQIAEGDGDHEFARELLDHALRIERQPHHRKWRLEKQGLILLWQGAVERARSALEEAFDLSRAGVFDGSWDLGPLYGLGLLELLGGDLTGARSRFEELRARTGHGRFAVAALLYLAETARLGSDLTGAADLVEEAMARQPGRLGLLAALRVQARLAMAGDDIETAARLFGAAERVREELGVADMPFGLWAPAQTCWITRAEGVDHVAVVRERLGEERFRALAAEEGAATPVS